MPTYEYECKSCGHTFEVFQAMSDEPIKKCPECGRAVRRLIFGGAGVIFKGSGFYVTDKGKGSSGGGASAATKPGKPEPAAKDGAASPQGAAAASPPAGASKNEGGKTGSGEAPKTAAKTD